MLLPAKAAKPPFQTGGITIPKRRNHHAKAAEQAAPKRR